MVAALGRFPRAAATLALIGAFGARTLLFARPGMYGDADDYWLLAQSFDRGGGFSLTHYTEGLRGYSLPLVLYATQRVADAAGMDPMVFFRICSAALGACLFGWALPTLMARLLGGRIVPASTWTMAVLGFAYWRGYFDYSLSDMPALTLLVGGVLCLERCGASEHRGTWAFAAGATLAFAANMRPVNQVSLFGGMLVLGCLVAHRASLARAAGALAAYTIGAGIVLAPQGAINAHNVGMWSPLAQTDEQLGRLNLYVQQLGWGISIQRYETHFVPDLQRPGHEPTAVIFLDRRGEQIVGRGNAKRSPVESSKRHPLDLGRYLELVAEHPLFFLSAYGRHLFNGLDVAYPTPYPERVLPRSLLFALGNYLVLASAAAVSAQLIGAISLRRHGFRIALLGVLLSPAALAIPTAIEIRFALPFYVVAYGLFACRLMDRAARPQISPALFVAWLIVATVGGTMLAGATYADILGVPPGHHVWCTVCW